MRERRVAGEHLRVALAEVLREPLHQVDGPVLAARAADCNRQIAAIVLLVQRDARGEEPDDVVEEGAHRRRILQELPDGRV
jgi:hypothetical protein